MQNKVTPANVRLKKEGSNISYRKKKLSAQGIDGVEAVSLNINN